MNEISCQCVKLPKKQKEIEGGDKAQRRQKRADIEGR